MLLTSRRTLACRSSLPKRHALPLRAGRRMQRPPAPRKIIGVWLRYERAKPRGRAVLYEIPLSPRDPGGAQTQAAEEATFCGATFCVALLNELPSRG